MSTTQCEQQPSQQPHLGEPPTSSTTSNSSTSIITQRQIIEIDNSEFKEGGFNVDSELIVVEITPGGLVDGKLRIGDKIIAIGDTPVSNPEDANTAFLNSGAQLKIEVERGADHGLQSVCIFELIPKWYGLPNEQRRNQIIMQKAHRRHICDQRLTHE
ncbi:unnamed protein product [Toxocara canis]|uniref:PDZ domain-containing protein n=1 Tax=Toxocara canis TaxID=6265 RepID=A0A183U1R1_TOXCA|nr:unnamed protein product [Toxocara canis]